MYKILDSWKSNSRFQSILLKCSDNEMFNYNTYTYLHNVHKTKKDRHAEKGEHQDEPALWKMNKGKNCIRPVQLTLKYMNSVSHSKFRWTDYVIWIVQWIFDLRKFLGTAKNFLKSKIFLKSNTPSSLKYANRKYYIYFYDPIH